MFEILYLAVISLFSIAFPVPKLSISRQQIISSRVASHYINIVVHYYGLINRYIFSHIKSKLLDCIELTCLLKDNILELVLYRNFGFLKLTYMYIGTTLTGRNYELFLLHQILINNFAKTLVDNFNNRAGSSFDCYKVILWIIMLLNKYFYYIW